MDNYKIKEQQTKVIQRMLIKIHKERRKLSLLKKVEALQQEAEEQEEEYNPCVEDEQFRKERNKKELGEAMYDPETVLPRYCWKNPPLSENDEGRWPILPMPEYISRVKEEGNKNKRHRVHNPWPYPAALLEPLY